MYISRISLICHDGQLIARHQLCLSPRDAFLSVSLQRYEQAVVRPVDLHDSLPFQSRAAHDDELAQHLLPAASACFSAALSFQYPAQEALLDRLRFQERRRDVCRHGHDRKGEHLADAP